MGLKYTPKHWFEKYGSDLGCESFVETGTHKGTSVQYALDLGFKTVLSCEMMEDRFSECSERFEDREEVSLWHGMSVDALPSMLDQIKGKAIFWLDAHAEGGGVPTMEEIDMIKNLPRNDHTILIDDIPIYFSGREAQLRKKLLDINPDYEIVMLETLDNGIPHVMGAFLS